MPYQIIIVNGVIQTQPLDASETFLGTAGGPLASASVGDFWQWAYSDLVGNTDRGVLAEFIVAKAIRSVHRIRNPWASYDLETPSGAKVEVKSAAYLQAWYQKEPSKVQFSIRKTLEWVPKSNKFIEPKRCHSDVYVFCLIAEQDKQRLNPLDFSQWVFYVVPTRDIDARYGGRKSITLRQVRALSRGHVVAEVGGAVESAAMVE